MGSPWPAVILAALSACAGAPDRGAGPAPVGAVLADSARRRLAADWGQASRRVERALASPGLTREETVRLLVEKASIEREVGWFRRRTATADSMLTVARARAMVNERMSPATRAALTEAEGWLIYWRGFEHQESFDQALPLFEEARRLRAGAGDRAGLAASWFEIGLVHQQTGRLDPSRSAFARGHAIAVSDRLLVELAYLERHMGANAEQRGDLAAALTHYSRSLKLREESGHRWGEVFAAVAPEACRHLERAVRAWTRYGDPAAVAVARARAAEWSCPARLPR